MKTLGKMPPCHGAETTRTLATWRADPGAFCRDVLGVEPMPWQLELMKAAIGDGSRQPLRLSVCYARRPMRAATLKALAAVARAVVDARP